VRAPVLANLTEFGAARWLGQGELREAGVAMALYPLSASRAAAAASIEVYAANHGRFAERVQLPVRGRRAARPRLACVALHRVRDAELLQEPEDPVRARALEMMDLDHRHLFGRPNGERKLAYDAAIPYFRNTANSGYLGEPTVHEPTPTRLRTRFLSHNGRFLAASITALERVPTDPSVDPAPSEPVLSLVSMGATSTRAARTRARVARASTTLRLLQGRGRAASRIG